MATDLSDLRSLFADEAREYVQLLNDGMLRLEAEPSDRSVLHELFRAAHSLKGMAATVGLQPMVELAHALESVLDRFRSQAEPPPPDPHLFDLLFECTAVMKQLVEQAAQGSSDTDSGALSGQVTRLVRAIEALAEQGMLPGGSAGAGQAAAASVAGSSASGPAAGGVAGPGMGSSPGTAGSSGAASSPGAAGSPETASSDGASGAGVGGGGGEGRAAVGAVEDGGPAGGASEGNGPAGGDDLLWFLQAERLQQVREALAGGRAVFLVEVVLAPDCLFKGARAFTVLRALESVGSLLGSWPAREALLEERFDDRFVVALIASGPATEVEESLRRVPELREVRLTPVRTAPPAPGAAPSPANVAAMATAAVRSGAGGAGAGSQQALARPERAAPPAGAGSPARGAGNGRAAASAQLQVAREAAPLSARESTVRVETGRLDALVDLVGELVITTNQLQDAWQSRQQPDEAQMRKLSRVTSDLQSAVMRLRMVPLRHVFSRFPHTVRDLARRTGKQVQFIVEGEETELDRNIVNEIGDPLVHLLRNAIDHGIEPPEVRVKAGKPPAGRVRLSAYHEGNHVVIELEDDGAGIDIERIRQKAVETGRLSAEQAQAASPEDLLQLIFEPGFSTAGQVTDVSGRGVGMDAAKAAVEALGGRLSVHTRRGRGTLCVIRLPLTLAVIRALLVECAGEVYALPAEVVSSIERAPSQPEQVRGRPVLRYRGRVVPLVPLRERLGLAGRDGEGSGGLAVVLSTGRRTAAILVERVVGLREVVIRNLSGLASVPGVAGATILGSGRVALILDALWLL